MNFLMFCSSFCLWAYLVVSAITIGFNKPEDKAIASKEEILAIKDLPIVVLDTGYNLTKYNTPLCKGKVHYDSTENDGPTDKIPEDTAGHGSHVVNTINQTIQGVNLDLKSNLSLQDKIEKVNLNKLKGFCFIIVKYYKGNGFKESINDNWLKALKYISTIESKTFVLNISGGGTASYTEERNLIEIINKKAVIVAAAGNDRNDLKKETYYPAMYEGVLAVGNLKNENEVDPSSNYNLDGMSWRIGTVSSIGKDGLYTVMRGTSQATAVMTGDLVREFLETQNK